MVSTGRGRAVPVGGDDLDVAVGRQQRQVEDGGVEGEEQQGRADQALLAVLNMKGGGGGGGGWSERLTRKNSIV